VHGFATGEIFLDDAPSRMRPTLFVPCPVSPALLPGQVRSHSPTQKSSCFCSGSEQAFGCAAVLFCRASATQAKTRTIRPSRHSFVRVILVRITFAHTTIVRVMVPPEAPRPMCIIAIRRRYAVNGSKHAQVITAPPLRCPSTRVVHLVSSSFYP